jgi:predicted ATPase
MSARRIAVTGGPGGGKSTVWRVLAAAQGERVLAVPEVATLLFRHVFPPVESAAERCAVQRAIFRVQAELEQFYLTRAGAGQVLLCDRGSCDGAGYWPEGYDAFFAALDTSWERELARYDAVLFLETAAVGGYAIDEGNETRRETLAEAVAVDARLRGVWERHPCFMHIAHTADFAEKLANAQAALSTLL